MKNIAMLFPGQGAQYSGMGKQLFSRYEFVKDMFKVASDVLDMDMEHLCFEAPADQLNSTENTQPALVLCGAAAYRVFQQETGLQPVVMAGHSIGEITALISAEAISFEDGLKLARARGQAMAACSQPGETGMAAVVKLDRTLVEDVCQTVPGYGEDFVIANYNSAAQLVISGRTDALEQAKVALKEKGASYIPLRVSGAFHSPLMKPAASEFANLLKNIGFSSPKIPVIANVNAKPYADVESIPTLLTQQISQSVLWQESMEKLVAGEFEEIKLASDKIDLFVETGPGVVIKKLTSVLFNDALSYSLDHDEDKEPLDKQLEIDVRTIQYQPAFLGKCMAVAVSTRNNNFDNSSYQENVIEPYHKLKEMHELCTSEERLADASEMKLGLQLLEQIMTSKGAEKTELEQRFREIATVTGQAQVLEDYLG
ncbi:ACP S-malonyltransferase [Pleionea sp. CnH1-48]|uniref:ACP S-malonyltransferase n=1 Tax=Pleionea sp. CnH1-48 TaxID=2954494 RepID=UPI002097D62E|nr:ACP S-malonyltransferase [Pleionea sp. CnH1-48]MCO7224346.1 ACP S-malonyltransferase [Pleionea sp. CnH1-48]